MTGETFLVSPMHEMLCRNAERSLPELKSMPRDKFIEWLWENEEMYSIFRQFATQARQAGREHFSVYMIRERVRWYVDIEGGSDFKISNNLTPYIARTLIMEDPRFADVFKIKGDE